jgi:hypothetical protein
MPAWPLWRRTDPHYSPTERMAILELMAAHGWSKAEAGRHFLVTDDTVASWSGRIEEDELGALVKSTVPVNKFPDFVAAMVIKLKTLFPMMGRRRIAGFLTRAGLHIAATTVRRMLNRKPAQPSRPPHWHPLRIPTNLHLRPSRVP